MTLVIDKIRRLEKTSTITGETPTVPPNNDHTTGWADTDIYERELFVNLNDGKLFTREGSDVVEFGIADLITTPNLALVTNGSDAVTFTVETFDYVLNGRTYTHSQVIDEVSITDGDVTNSRYYIVVVDDAMAISVVEGVASLNPIIPTVPSEKLLVGVIFVPANHTSVSNPIETVGRDIFINVQSNVIIDWAVGKTLIEGMYVNESNILYKVIVSHISDDFLTDRDVNSYLISVGGSGSYTGTATVTVGGVTAGDSFVSQTPVAMLKNILEPFVNPNFTSFSMQAYSVLEVGDEILAGLTTFNWSTNQSGNVEPNTVEIIDVTNANTSLDSGLANDGTENVTVPQIIKVTNAFHQFKIQADYLLPQVGTFTLTYNVNWRWRGFYGKDSNAVLNETEIEALTGGLQTGYAATYVLQQER